MSLRFALLYAARSLRRGGQRSILAVVCIAFGVLALVAMQMLAAAVMHATVIPAELKIGGDLTIRPRADAVQDSTALDALLAEGTFTGLTTMVSTSVATMRSMRSGRVQFIGRAFGVDAATYPLVGAVTLQNDVTLANELSEPLHAVLTRDLAGALGVVPGDTIRIGGGTQPAQRIVLGGIALAVPDRNGQTVLFSHETSRILAGDDARVPWHVATLAPGMRERAGAVLAAAGYEAEFATDRSPDSTSRVFGLMLRGAGILGLLVGGIGIAYTLHVMLTRRRLEIATLRTIGYRTGHLLALFGIEALILGAVGGLLGTAAAVALSAELVRLLDRVGGALMLEHTLDARYLVLGPVVGMATAALFGTAAIVRASGVRPGVLLRDLPVRAGAGASAASAGLYLLLAVLFTAVSTMIMGSVPAGAVVVAIAAVGTVVLGGLLALLLRLLVAMPMPHLPLLNMARANLRSQPTRSAFALIALFIGVFAIGVAAAALTTGRDRVAARRGSDEGYNLRVHPGPGEHNTVERALRDAGAAGVVANRSASVRTRTAAGRDLGMLRSAVVVTPADLDALAQVDGIWTGAAGDAVVAGMLRQPPFGIAQGDTLYVTGPGGERPVRVAAFHAPRDGEFFAAPQGIVVSAADAAALGVDTVASSFVARVDVARLDEVSAALGASLPGSLLVSRRDLNEFLVATYRNLFLFVIAIAGLALVAGAVLVANAVSLAMLERRRELGILMAVGFTSRRVLRTILLENGALGLVAGAAGLAAVHIVIAIVNARESAAELGLATVPGVLLVLTAILLATGAATAVAWGPVHVRPLEVLRDE